MVRPHPYKMGQSKKGKTKMKKAKTYIVIVSTDKCGEKFYSPVLVAERDEKGEKFAQTMKEKFNFDIFYYGRYMLSRLIKKKKKNGAKIIMDTEKYHREFIGGKKYVEYAKKVKI